MGKISDLLPEGRENAVSAKELSRLAGVSSVRELQKVIARERADGALILSTCENSGGYFRPSKGEAGQREIAAFVATLHARALNTLRALRAARAALDIVDGQIDLDDLECK